MVIVGEGEALADFFRGFVQPIRQPEHIVPLGIGL